MQLQISMSSKTPIYEQIADQIRTMILRQELAADQALPSVRSVARDYHISALTVKKAYDHLEQEGYVSTVHGKGTYVNAIDQKALEQEDQRQLEAMLDTAIEKARRLGWEDEKILDLVRLLLEETK